MSTLSSHPGQPASGNAGHFRPRRPRSSGLPTRDRIRWLAFAIGALAAVAGLAWVTRAVVTLERDQASARAEAARAETIRLALWRLDSWMAPRLAAEAARPYFHYLALYPPRRAYDQFLSPIAAGEVLTPSPLLSFRDEVVRLHVQVDATGRVTSPQAPEDAPWNAQLEPLVVEQRRGEVSQLLDRARQDLGGIPLVRRVEEVVACQTLAIADDPQSDTPFVSGLLDKMSNRAPLQWAAGLDDTVVVQSTETAPREVALVRESAPSLGNLDALRPAASALEMKAPSSHSKEGSAAETKSSERPPLRDAPRQLASTSASGAADQRRDVPGPVASSGRQPTESSQIADRRSSAGEASAAAEPVADAAAPKPSDSLEAAINRKQRAARQQQEGQVQSRAAVDNDYAKRLIQSSAAQVGAPVQVEPGPGEPMVDVGPFVPLWVTHADEAPGLYYFRRVSVGSAELAQGFLVDWPTLAQMLGQQVEDLLPHATVQPVGLGAGEGLASSIIDLEDAATDETRLASIPARLVPGPCDPAAMPSGLTPARATLGAAWIALLAAIIAAGFSLHAVAADAARRTRFAGVVTHELRTPLTTFQLYTDMLVDGMVPPENRGEYLTTLRDESHRLGHLVENVLSYARIEQGRHTARLEETTASEILARVEQPLRRRAESAGFEFRIELEVAEPERRFRVDVESVERILFNLVDNAAKYASHGRPCEGSESWHRHAGDGPEAVAATEAARPEQPSTSPRSATLLILRIEQLDGTLQLAVIDHGPGVPAPQRPRLFRPFERGSDDHTQQQRGIGLGLALSRELARALGGDLRHEPTPGGGATFRLVVA